MQRMFYGSHLDSLYYLFTLSGGSGGRLVDGVVDMNPVGDLKRLVGFTGVLAQAIARDSGVLTPQELEA